MVVRDALSGEERLVLQGTHDCNSVIVDAQNVYVASGNSDILIVPRAAIAAAAAQPGRLPTILKADWQY